MRVCIQKSTGQLLSSQSGGETQEHLDTLIANAVSAGYSENDLDAHFCDDAKFAEIMAKQHESEKTYATRRSVEYPPVTDYLDGIVKGDQAQVQAYIDACLVVKAKYPKA